MNKALRGLFGVCAWSRVCVLGSVFRIVRGELGSGIANLIGILSNRNSKFNLAACSDELILGGPCVPSWLGCGLWGVSGVQGGGRPDPAGDDRLSKNQSI